MKINVWNTILQLSRERGVDPSVIVNAIKESLKVASSQYFTQNENVTIDFQPEKGNLRVYAVKQIIEDPQDTATEISLSEAKKIDAAASSGNYIEIDLPSDTLGRISAQAAKQVIFQKVRTAEQERVFSEFTPLLGEIVVGIVRRFEPNSNIILEVNKTEALLPHRDILPNDEFRRGDRVRAVISHVYREEKGHQVILSRTSSKFLVQLLKLEIPEISDGTIRIKDICRQPGERSKVAVITNAKDVDPIGACIGVKGNRILSISKELGGEKIDIVEWNEDPLEYAKSALSPAKPTSISISNQQDKILKAKVPKDQLSLAIGKKGINVRLASRLVGWRIDIKDRDE